jgi:hypothetical protein
MPPLLYASTTILLGSLLVEFFDFEGDLPYVSLRKKRREKGSKALAPFFTRVLKTDPSKIALVIYEILRTNPCS